jgi:hypothetical protein
METAPLKSVVRQNAPQMLMENRTKGIHLPTHVLNWFWRYSFIGVPGFGSLILYSTIAIKFQFLWCKMHLFIYTNS